MMHNNLYNLMLQLTEENKSLWRIKDEYITNAEGDEESIALWKQLEADKERNVEALTDLIRKLL